MTRAWITPRKKRRYRQVAEQPVLQLPVAAPLETELGEDEAVREPEIERGVAVVDFYI
jgi:hypothetical protein